MPSGIRIDKHRIADFCRRWNVTELALFGSVLREDFGPESDVDVLVEFEQGAVVGLLDLAEMEFELSDLLGRRVDIRTPFELSKHFRRRVLAEAEDQYVRG